jgi:hypothetical protein
MPSNTKSAKNMGTHNTACKALHKIKSVMHLLWKSMPPWYQEEIFFHAVSFSTRLLHMLCGKSKQA